MNFLSTKKKKIQIFAHLLFIIIIFLKASSLGLWLPLALITE